MYVCTYIVCLYKFVYYKIRNLGMNLLCTCRNLPFNNGSSYAACVFDWSLLLST